MKSEANNFYYRVYEIVCRIPKGKVTTYGSIAAALGSKSSSRMVGWALNAAKGSEIPAHRVINRLGELSGKRHFGTPDMMKELLVSEGITFKNDRVNLEEHFWDATINR